MNIRRRAPRRAVPALVAALALGGCASALPTDPVPQPGLSVEVQPRQDVQRFLPSPQPGASPEEIVQGFLRANVGFADDEDVAREYLTSTLASEWVPTRDVLVLEGNQTVEEQASGEVTVTTPVQGRIDEQGRLTEQPVAPISRSFELQRVDGEWRISAFPEGFGLWLSAADLDRAFRPSTVYYLNPHLDLFVPDVRWLALGDGLTTSLARTQLAEVPSHLEGAVRTGGGPDLRLAVGAVPVDPTTQMAVVNLQGSGLSDDPDRVADLRAQLGHSLLGLRGVSAVDLRVAGRSLLEEGAVNLGSELGYEEVVRETEVGLLRIGEELVPVDPTRYDLRNLPVGEVQDLDLPRVGMSWTGVAASADLSELTAVSADRSELWRWRDGESEVHAGIGDELTDPSFDPHGDVWVAGTSRGAQDPRVWVLETGDVSSLARPVEVPWLADGERVETLRVSPDGTRALLVVRAERGSARDRVLVAGIVRDSQGRATALAEPWHAAPTLVEVASARWASTTDLVVAARRTQDQRVAAFTVPLGGWLDSLPDQAGLVDVQAVPTGQSFVPVARTEDGRLHTRDGPSVWFGARNGDELIVPGT
ncbi:LpqB family beta-propeller domain-containing protein [uncultured Ornithinimicrobium sp.]|uniref:LpqB family beta-propeller domain-containing protein n=1 Tax=uncultured Ornithinimicrobium sp. TaxID=259307 RepID=UPI0025935DCF|nr:LpqB family beta-propeller domain-containing protein [uncultured Ornithinimicrobium sp.]